MTTATASTIGYTMIGVSFQQVGGDPLDINTLFDDAFVASLTGGYGTSDSDTIMVWNNGGYTTYYYSAADWSEEAGDGEADAYKNNKWLTIRDELATIDFEPGSAAWFCRAKGATKAITGIMSGEVPTGTKTVEIAAGDYAMIASATPATFDLNNSGIDWAQAGVLGGYGTSDSDTIQVWDGTGYATYYFSAADWSEEAGDGEEDAYKDNKWLTIRDELVSTPIDICKGFWFKRNGETKLTLTLP